jgi:hypothetical protein
MWTRHRTIVTVLFVLSMMTNSPTTWAEEPDRIVNGSFEQATEGWSQFWSRDDQGEANLVSTQRHDGESSLLIEYDGGRDWSLGQETALAVHPGDIYELAGWARISESGSVTLGVILRDANRQTLSWQFAGRTAHRVGDWKRLRVRFVVPPSGTEIVPRFTGFGPVTAYVDGVSLVKVGTVDQLRNDSLPEQLTIASQDLSVTFHPATGGITVHDKRSNRRFEPADACPYPILSAERHEQQISFRMLKPDDALIVEGTIRMDGNGEEFVVSLRGEGELTQPLAFPSPFRTEPGEFLIVPVNEGISYPVDDNSLSPMEYYLWGGHGLCMAFWGVTDTQTGLMAIIETPDDARVKIPRVNERLCLAPQWASQKQSFGSERRIRYIPVRQGGYVAMCKRYRRYVQQIGQFKTLAEKREENSNVDRLVGAANVWCWDRPAIEMCEELREAGIERILWSRRSDPQEIAKLNEMGVLSSRYDIYQDVMNPKEFEHLRWIHPDWTTSAWPDDLLIDRNGQWERGWRVKGKDGQWYPCGVLCDRQAVPYARERISKELKTHAYVCRFIDTTTASPWRECYHDDHPMTRSDSRRAKMELLDLISGEFKLVTGSETGHDAAVPFVHYFEGMLSLGPYRIPDAGRNMLEAVEEVPARVAKFQTGHYYRLPLWELVYHDCVVAQWYWGDYNNKLPMLWDRRDLINALYGTPPMFLFNQKIWKANRTRFVQSYNTATPVAYETAYNEMLSHDWLTSDHSVQQTRFANGVCVTVNFGDRPFTMKDHFQLEPLTHRVTRDH